MTLQEIQDTVKNGKYGVIKQPENPPKPIPELPEINRFIAILEMLRRPKYHLTTAPTFTPKTFLEQIQFYDDTTDRRIYFYVNGSWSYITLT